VSRLVRLSTAAALVAAACATVAPASADPLPDVDPPIHTFCTVHFREVPIFTNDVPVQPVVPYFAC